MAIKSCPFVGEDNHLCPVPPAPRRFTAPLGGVGEWSGGPSVAYGSARRLAYEARSTSGLPSVRMLYGEAARRGDPWGGLRIELDGHTYHFGAGMGERTHLLGPDGLLSHQGNLAMAAGVQGKLTVDWVDWRWVQDELDLTWLFDEGQRERLVAYYEQFGVESVLIFQSRSHAKEFDQPLLKGGHNCTTIHVENISRELGMEFSEFLPLPFFDRMSGFCPAPDLRRRGLYPRNALECRLNRLLHLPEVELMEVLKHFCGGHVEYNGLAKGLIPAPKSDLFRTL